MANLTWQQKESKSHNALPCEECNIQLSGHDNKNVKGKTCEWNIKQQGGKKNLWKAFRYIWTVLSQHSASEMGIPLQPEWLIPYFNNAWAHYKLRKSTKLKLD